MSAIDRMNELRITGGAVPEPGSEEARHMMEKETFADQQWARRRAGIMGRDEIKMAHLVQIKDPSTITL
jgi:hypothetical protein